MLRRSFMLGIVPSIAHAEPEETEFPTALCLDDEADQDAFRRWFTFLAEVQYFTSVSERPAEIVDCSALLRYAYREALRLHDEKWSRAARLPLIPAIPSVAKYNYPHTPVGANLFRLKDGTFAQFADAETLRRWNTSFISRDVRRARAGDLLFYRKRGVNTQFHSMIFLGASQIRLSQDLFVVYDTGPDGTINGEIRRRSLDELLQYPDPQWQPRPVNRCFLGVFRWNILRAASS